jgi:NADH-quinone oxidoreductase subunit H
VIICFLVFVLVKHLYFFIICFILFWLVFVGGLFFVMFFTTCERKLLGLIQRRVGPRFVGIRGRLQYLADSLKLLVKVFTGPRRLNASLFQGAAFGAF